MRVDLSTRRLLVPNRVGVAGQPVERPGSMPYVATFIHSSGRARCSLRAASGNGQLEALKEPLQPIARWCLLMTNRPLPGVNHRTPGFESIGTQRATERVEALEAVETGRERGLGINKRHLFMPRAPLSRCDKANPVVSL